MSFRRTFWSFVALSAALTVHAAPAFATATASLQGTTLTISGDGANDVILLSPNLANLDVDLDGNGVADASFPQASVDATIVNAGGGNDTVSADTVPATEPVTINGEGGADALRGSDGANTVSGGDGPDLIAGDRGDDLLAGGAGDDTFSWFPGDGSETIEGDAGDDVFVQTGSGASENMTLNPGPLAGHVRLFRDVAAITTDLVAVERLDVRMLGGTDTFTGGVGVGALVSSVAVHGGAGTDTLNGGDEADTLVGGPDADTLNGNGGGDTFPVSIFDTLVDAINGGGNVDTLAVSGTDSGETYTIDTPMAGQLTVSEAVEVKSVTGAALERAEIETLGGNDSAALTPAAAADITVDLRGGSGNDVFSGGAGADVLRGGDGADRLSGAAGDDQLFGDAGDDVLTGGLGADQFQCGGFGDLLDAAGDDVVGADCLAPSAPAPPPAPVQPAPAPATANPDVTAPLVTLGGIPKTIRRSTLLKSGLSFTVSPNEPSSIEAALLVTARSAVFSAAAAPNLTLASRTLSRSGARRRIVLKPSRRLVGRARRFALTVRVVATDASGNRRTVTRKVTVR